MKMADNSVENEQRCSRSRSEPEGAEPQEVVIQHQAKSMKLIGKRRVNIKANGKPKVTEKVFRIIVEADCMCEEDLPDNNGQTSENVKLAIGTELKIHQDS